MLAAIEPSVPLNLDLVSRSSSSLTFSWEAPSDSGGVELLGYKVYVASGNDEYV